MKRPDPDKYHKLYGTQQKRGAYFKKDFIDYLLMVLLTGGFLTLVYGPYHFVTITGLALCLFMIVTFPMRHGVELRVPLILRRPQDIIHMLIYKVENLNPIYYLAIVVLLAENIFIYFTPSLPHHTEVMRTIAVYLFFVHLAAFTVYRTVSLVAHLKNSGLVREFLLQTPWKTKVEDKNIHLEIIHAYITGVLTHVVLLAPWFFVITHAQFSVLLIPLMLAINFFTHNKWMKAYNDWFYRDHWLGHNSEFEFVYLHGTHHDSIPSGLIAVAGNGFLEGFLRHSLGSPVPFYNPIFSCLMYTLEIKGDIDLHQFIPRVFPRVDMEIIKGHQHSMHHFGRLTPYGFGTKYDQPDISEGLRNKLKRLPDEVRNSIRLDEELNGFKWDNRPFRKMLDLYEKYRES